MSAAWASGKMLPNTITITDEQFQSFLEKTVANDFGRRTLDKLTAQNAATATSEPTGAVARDNPTQTAIPAEMVQDSGVDEDTGEGKSARVSG